MRKITISVDDVTVALRKESVDRNARKIRLVAPDIVALRKESVDRNILGFGFTFCQVWSLSARRAWIEISNHQTVNYHVARRSPQGERG